MPAKRPAGPTRGVAWFIRSPTNRSLNRLRERMSDLRRDIAAFLANLEHARALPAYFSPEEVADLREDLRLVSYLLRLVATAWEVEVSPAPPARRTPRT